MMMIVKLYVKKSEEFLSRLSKQAKLEQQLYLKDDT